MNAFHFRQWCTVAVLAVLATSFGFNKANATQPDPADTGEGMQVLTRGPVHEAFAETVTFDPEPGIVVPKASPAAIEELPPDQRPEGANVAWIPGYWAWDDERSDFLWVSGIWRDLPPGRQWVPGYWGQVTQGDQWTTGYWADANATEVEYLSEPPATVEVGPNIDAPSADHTWLPGCWVWQQNRYAWRPGFWATAQPNWVWIPAHYVYAPRGYVFVDGYWDYSVGRRGVLFAPVYFDSGVYARRGFSYSPSIAIDLGVFANHLFLRPQYQHYYFGDYYAANYRTAGFHASYSFNSSRYGYDPIYAHRRWEHRQDREWEHRVEADFRNRRDHEDARPPRTWAAQRALGTSDPASRERMVAAPLSQLAASKGSSMRFQAVDKLERQKLGQHGQEVQRFRDERQKRETKAAATSREKPSKEFAPAKVRFPNSPIAAKSAREAGQDQTLPKTHEAPKPDLRVEARPRATRSPERPREYSVNREPLDTNQPPATGPQQPQVDQPTRQTQPQPQAERPTRQAQPQPQAEQPIRQAQPQPKVDQPTRQTQPQPQAERPIRQAQPQPKAERPTRQAQPQPQAERPTRQAQPQPKAEQPTRQTQPQPKAERPTRQAQPQPKAERPTRQAQPQPKAERPTRQAQPQPKAERPSRQAQPQPKAERPTRQSQPQPKAERPTRQAQPQAERSNPPPRSASPSPGAKQDRPKGKGKN